MNIRKTLCGMLFLSALVLIAYAQNSKLGAPVTSASSILKDFKSYYNYEYYVVKLSDDYTAYNESAQPISHQKFLQTIAGGGYLPVKLQSKSPVFQLYKLPAKVNSDIYNQLKEFGKLHLQFYNMEGKLLPDYHFTDIKGHQYNRATTAGKIVVIKCWFIHCSTCVQEMPQVNALVDTYKNRKDVLFVSLAFDSKPKLEKFLKKTIFKYAVVPDKEAYMMNKLQISGYPTHLIVNRQGKIAKVIQNVDDLKAVLPKQINM